MLENGLLHKERKCLESLSILEHPGLTDRALAAIANSAGTTLKALVISGSAWITDAGAVIIAKKCPHLTHLSLASCSGITDDGVQAVVKGCSLLAELNLARCSRLTMLGLQMIEVSTIKLKCNGLARLL